MACLLAFAMLVFNWYTLAWADYFSQSFMHKFLMTFQLFWIAFLILKICQQPSSQEKLSYQAPFVPFLPIVAIWFNVYWAGEG